MLGWIQLSLYQVHLGFEIDGGMLCSFKFYLVLGYEIGVGSWVQLIF
jgi:hypothetical protein